jgi:hypothetical protein
LIVRPKTKQVLHISDRANSLKHHPAPRVASEATAEEIVPVEILDYNSYVEERNARVEAAFKISEALDKAVLGLSSGALTLTIAFLEKVAVHPVREILLAFAWGSWGCAISFSLVSIYLGLLSHGKAIDNLDKEQRTRQPVSKNCWRAPTSIVTALSVAAFVTGVGSFASFSFYNVPDKTRTTEMKSRVVPSERGDSKGATAPPPRVPAPSAPPSKPTQSPNSPSAKPNVTK